MDHVIVEFMSGPCDGQVVALPLEAGAGTFVLGRGRDCAVMIPHDDQVSRRHCRLTVREEGCVLEDLASRNGTFWDEDDRRLLGPEPLPAGAVFRVGCTRLRVRFARYGQE